MRIALIGDVHRCWDARDSEHVDGLGYDLVCFVGDLPDPLHRGMLTVARAISQLKTPAIVLPGNHDGPSPLGVLREALGVWWPVPGTARRALARLDHLQDALGPVPLAGFSIHPFPDHDLSVVAARPFAMDGRRASFPELLEARHGLRTLDDSASRLIELLDAASGRIVVLAHNGPTGLGADARAPFSLHGRRDLGDPDLSRALAWARSHDRRVLAVLAGHLHHDGRSRRWCVDLDGTTVVNAARVPRIDHHTGRERRHHVAVHVGLERVTAEQVAWEPTAPGPQR